MMIESLTGRKFQSNGNKRYGEELIEIEWVAVIQREREREREERERERGRKKRVEKYFMAYKTSIKSKEGKVLPSSSYRFQILMNSFDDIFLDDPVVTPPGHTFAMNLS